MPQAPKAVEERALGEFNNDVERAAKQIANDLGPAPGTQKTSDAKLRSAWWTRDPSVDRQVLLAQLMTRGLPPQAAGKLVLVQPGNHPDWLPLYLHQAPDPNTAQVLAAFAEYPFRASILMTEADPEDRAKLAERLTGQGPPQARQAPAPAPSANTPATPDAGAAQPGQPSSPLPAAQQPPPPPATPGRVGAAS